MNCVGGFFALEICILSLFSALDCTFSCFSFLVVYQICSFFSEQLNLTMVQAASNESADKVEQAFLLQLLQSLTSNKKEVLLPLLRLVQ